MVEKLDVSFICILPDPEFNRQTICIQFDLPTINPVLKKNTQNGFSSKWNISKILPSGKIISSQKLRHGNGKKIASRSFIAKETESFISNKAFTAKYNTPDVNDIKEPLSVDLNTLNKKSVGIQGKTMARASQKKARRKISPFLGDSFKRKRFYIQMDIPTYHPIWKNGTQDKIISKRTYSKISAAKRFGSSHNLRGHIYVKDVPKLSNMVSSSLTKKHTNGKAAKPTVINVVHGGKVGVKRIGTPLIKKPVTRKLKKLPSNIDKLKYAIEVSNTAQNKTEMSTTYEVKTPGCSSKQGSLNEPRSHALSFLGDFLNRKIIYIQSENRTLNQLQVNGIEDRLDLGVVNPEINQSSWAESSQKSRVLKSIKERTKFSRAVHNSLFEISGGKTAKPYASGPNKVHKIKAHRSKKLTIKKANQTKDMNSAIKLATEKYMKPGVSLKDYNLDEPWNNTIAHFGSFVLNGFLALCFSLFIANMLSLPYPKLTRS